MTDREHDILLRILDHCKEIEDTVKRFGDDLATFAQDSDYKKSVVFTFLQIGELTTQLSDEFRAAHPDVPWKQIRGVRNIAAHHYGKLDENTIFESIHDDVPSLKEYISSLMEAEDQK